MKINRPLAWIQGEDGQTLSIGWKSCAPWPGRELHDQVVCSMTRLYSSRIKDVSIYRAERIQSIVNSVALVCSRVHGRSTHEACQVRVVVVVQRGLNRFKFAGILLRCINSLAEECISCILEGYIDLDCMYGVTEDRLRSCSADHAYLSSCLACVWVISFLWNQHFHIHQPAICESTCKMRINLPYAYIFSNASINLINLHYMIQNASINSTCLKSQSIRWLDSMGPEPRIWHHWKCSMLSHLQSCTVTHINGNLYRFWIYT